MFHHHRILICRIRRIWTYCIWIRNYFNKSGSWILPLISQKLRKTLLFTDSWICNELLFLKIDVNLHLIKGTVPQDFRLQVFLWISFPQAPEYTIRAENFENSQFLKFTLRCQQSDIVPIICHRCRWHRQQICWQYRWHRHQYQKTPAVTVAKFAAVVVDTGGKFAAGVCRWYRWCTFTSEYLCEFLIKFRNDPNVIFGGLGEDDSWKTWSKKSCGTVPLIISNSSGQCSGSGIRDWVPFWPRDPGWEKVSIRIRDPGWKKVGSGINIPDPPHC